MENSEVVDNRDESRFEISIEGRRVGSLSYELADGAMTFTEIETAPDVAGRGLGLVLVRGALDAATAESLTVRPASPFVRDYIERHPTYLDLVPPDERARFDLPV
jgi:predicted GNAT family acetyltransferase